MSAHDPQGQALNPGNLTQTLQSTASLQIGKGIRPICFSTTVVDSDNLELLLSCSGLRLSGVSDGEATIGLEA